MDNYKETNIDDVQGLEKPNTNIENIEKPIKDIDIPQKSKSKTNDTLFVITKDSNPLFYTKSHKDAVKYMWQCARRNKYNFDDYNTYLCEKTKNTIHLIGFYRFFIVAYDYVISEFKIHTVSKLNKDYLFTCPTSLCMGRNISEKDTTEYEDVEEELVGSGDDVDKVDEVGSAGEVEDEKLDSGKEYKEARDHLKNRSDSWFF